MRVVIDTNAWISRLSLADSVAARAVDKALARFEVVVSEVSVEALADVLSREKFDRYVSLQDREEFLRRLLQVTTMVPVLSEITDCRDPKDNRFFLALALDSESDCMGVTLILSVESIVHAYVIHHRRQRPWRAAAGVGRIPLALSTPHPRRRCASWCSRPRTRAWLSPPRGQHPIVAIPCERL